MANQPCDEGLHNVELVLMDHAVASKIIRCRKHQDFRPIKNPDALLLPLRACNRALLLPLRAVIGPYNLMTIVMNFLMGGPRSPLYLLIFLQY